MGSLSSSNLLTFPSSCSDTTSRSFLRDTIHPCANSAQRPGQKHAIAKVYISGLRFCYEAISKKVDFLTFVLFAIVLASFINKNTISRPVHASKQFQKIRLFLTFGQILIVLASFTKKNVISGPVHATKQFRKK